MRAEVVAIHTALTLFTSHARIGICRDSLSYLHAIRHQTTIPGTSRSLHYHHHMLLISNITNLLETRRSTGLRKTFRKNRAHRNIRGYDLADATAKRAVKDYDT
jgi:hypothetical protein